LKFWVGRLLILCFIPDHFGAIKSSVLNLDRLKNYLSADCKGQHSQCTKGGSAFLAFRTTILFHRVQDTQVSYLFLKLDLYFFPHFVIGLLSYLCWT
jgi:hypothetical protein